MLAHLLSDLHHKGSRLQRVGASIFKYIADDIPIGVTVPIFWFVTHVGAHRFRASKSRSFTDQQDHHIWLDQIADIIHYTDTGVLDKKRGSKTQTRGGHPLFDDRKDLPQIGLDGGGGQPIPNCQLYIYVLLAFLVDGASRFIV